MERITLSAGAEKHEFSGTVIGAATSESPHHSHPEDYLSAASPPQTGRRQKCSACRWLETTLYRTDDDRYVVYTNGRSIVPGEQDYVRVTITSSAYEVVEVLTVKKAAEPFIPLPSARALAQAASRDDDIQEAYVNRAVYR